MYGGLTINSASGRISENESSSFHQSSPSSVTNLADESSVDFSSDDNEIFTGAPLEGSSDGDNKVRKSNRASPL
jgi:hypothetical protein